METYLEARWGDVHVRFCSMISAALQPLLPEGLRALSEEEVVLEGETVEAPKVFRPDAMVIQSGSAASAQSSAMGTPKAAVADEIELDFSLLEAVDRWVQIIDTGAGNRVVTAIEILSPSNKAVGPSNERYRKKIEKYINAGVNLVEIDLLRSSRNRLIVNSNLLPRLRAAAYAVCIWRVTRALKISVIPIQLRSPLPTIPIPCRETDAEVPLSLQDLIDQIYIDGGHDDIDYSKPLREPLSPADAAWAAELVTTSR
jgi:hypothetical protein